MSAASKDGFTIVEVLIAIVILSVGMLALATTSIVATTQVKIADLKTERSLAVQEMVEMLRAGPWSEVTTRSEGSAVDAGTFEVWWDVSTINQNLRRVDLYTRGPGYVSGHGWSPAEQDTFTVEIANATI